MAGSAEGGTTNEGCVAPELAADETETAGATDGEGAAAGGAEERDGSGAAMPMSVLERSEFGAIGRTLGELGAAALGGAEARVSVVAGGGAEARAAGAGAGSAPQSVSMSSVDGGMEGGVGARGG